MRLGLITYDSKHLKTEHVALGLRQRGYDDLAFFALPFVQRAPRQIVFAHRPDMSMGAHSRDVAEAVGASYEKVSGPEQIAHDAADLFLILGAGLLPPAFVSGTLGRVVNAHPGIIPIVRGLDAFKWAIVDGMPIGNTLHFIDEEADAGEVLGVEPTPLFADDTLESFARRHYELEILMMIGFETYLDRRREQLEGAPRPPRMRMPHSEQTQLRDSFVNYKARFALGRGTDGNREN
jgi:phosphoribosylglycinamide formyltransferase-1